MTILVGYVGMLGTPGVVLNINKIQVEDVTNQSNTAPGEYVSVGVLGSPFHGAGIDGVKFFDTTNGNSVVNGVLYEWRGEPIPEATLLGYKSEGSRTNLCLRSNAFTTTWTASGAPVFAQNVTGPDGVANSAWTLTDNSSSLSYIAQGFALTAAAHTGSIFIRKTTGAQSSYPVVWMITGTIMAPVTVDTSNGIATAWTAYTGYTIASGFSATCKSFNADYWRIELTLTATADTWSIRLAPAGTTNPTQSTGVMDVAAQGSAVIYGAQVELGSFASSYIPTTTASVTRQEEGLGCSAVSFINQAEGTMYAEATVNGTPNSHLVTLSDTTTNERIHIGNLGVGVDAFVVVDGSVVQANINIGTCLIDTNYKRAGGYTTNSFMYARNGVLSAEDTSGTLPTVNYLRIGAQYVGNSPTFGNIKNVAIWNKKLPDSALQDITE
jgi:hypothetical protein